MTRKISARDTEEIDHALNDISAVWANLFPGHTKGAPKPGSGS